MMACAMACAMACMLTTDSTPELRHDAENLVWVSADVPSRLPLPRVRLPRSWYSNNDRHRLPTMLYECCVMCSPAPKAQGSAAGQVILPGSVLLGAPAHRGRRQRDVLYCSSQLLAFAPSLCGPCRRTLLLPLTPRMPLTSFGWRTGSHEALSDFVATPHWSGAHPPPEEAVRPLASTSGTYPSTSPMSSSRSCSPPTARSAKSPSSSIVPPARAKASPSCRWKTMRPPAAPSPPRAAPSSTAVPSVSARRRPARTAPVAATTAVLVVTTARAVDAGSTGIQSTSQ
jgi:hypothetical protein